MNKEEMFSKAKGDKIPFSEIAHIDALTMAYVLSLRENPEEDEYMKNLSEEDKKLLEAETKPLRKGSFLLLFGAPCLPIHQSPSPQCCLSKHPLDFDYNTARLNHLLPFLSCISNEHCT